MSAGSPSLDEAATPGEPAAIDAAATIDAQWRALVTAALLGTDRRDPPEPVGPIADLVADAARSSPSERMLDHVAAMTVVRRAAVIPAGPAPALAPPAPDDRRECVPAAVDRWHHITTSWPILEDEWTIALVTTGWRLAAELVPVVLDRHRRDPVRHARARIAAGPLAEWLIEQLPELGATRTGSIDPAALTELPDLPIDGDLLELLHADGDTIGSVLGRRIEHGELAHPHRAVLVNLLARVAPDGLARVADGLEDVDPTSPGAGLASVLADLARTRERMLDELSALQGP